MADTTRFQWRIWGTCVFIGWAFGASGPAALAIPQGREVPAWEAFALAADREAALRDLVPGSDLDFYLRGLHALNQGQLAAVPPLLQQWRDQLGETDQWRKIRNRWAVLALDTNYDEAWSIIRRELQLDLAHQRELPPAGQNLPTTLDAKLLSAEGLLAERFPLGLTRLTERGLRALGPRVLETPAATQREILQRLNHPGFPHLVDLVTRELQDQQSGGFGSLPIHSALTLEQLRECLKRLPNLADNRNFVMTWLTHLQNDPAPVPEIFVSRLAELERMWEFLRDLPPTHNSMKAALLYQRLELGRQTGQRNLDLFLAYLSLPREQDYVHPTLRQRLPERDRRVEFDQDFGGLLRCPPISSDRELVSDYLQHFLRDENLLPRFEALIEAQFLNEHLAQAQVLAGRGDAARWSAILGPSRLKELVERVDLEFHTVDKFWYHPDDAVSVELRLKNVAELRVRIFELNPLNCYLNSTDPVAADLALDGLKPNHERTLTFANPPAVQTVERVALPELTARGVYIVDFIGGGKNCRALLHKGRLTCVAQPVSAGHEFFVVNEDGQVVAGAAVWVGGRRFAADPQGLIKVPFSNQPGYQPVILEHAGFASAAYANIAAETYELTVGIHVERESLLVGKTARVLLRPSLRVAGVPVPATGRLNKPVVRIRAQNLEADAAVREFTDLVWDERGELVVEFPVPARLSDLNIELSGEVTVASQGRQETLRGETTVKINAIDKSPEILASQLLQSGDEFWLELRGKNGEPAPQWPALLQLQSQWCADPINVRLQSDASGRIALGELAGVERVTVTPWQCSEQSWELSALYFQSLPNTVTISAGQPWKLPIGGLAPTTDWQPHVFKVREGQFQQQLASEATQLAQGWLTGTPLSAGDYLLVFPDGKTVRLWCVAGRDIAGTLVNSQVHATLPTADSPAVEKVDLSDESLVIQVADATESTRVHVIATRYLPRFPVGSALGKIQDAPSRREGLRWDSNRFVSARQLGDEYLYILNRQKAPKFAGNMAERPSLLIAPWSLGTTESQQERLDEGGALSEGINVGEDASRQQAKSAENAATGHSDWGNLDWLAAEGSVLTNLRPDESGRLVIDRRQFAEQQTFTVVLVDLFSTAVVTKSAAVPELRAGDLRLTKSLSGERHYSLQKQTKVVPANEVIELPANSSLRLETVASMSEAWRQMLGWAGSGELAEFAILGRWSELPATEQEAWYAQHICHEVNFYLYHKDPQFFQRVIAPLLRLRHSPDFFDDWLLERDLARWTEPWQFQQLNCLEKILLSQRVPELRPAIVKHLDDQWRIRPNDSADRDRLFETVMAGASLSERQKLLSSSDPGQGGYMLDAAGERALPPGSAMPASPAEMSYLRDQAAQEFKDGGMGGGGMGGMGGMGAAAPSSGNAPQIGGKLRNESAEKSRGRSGRSRPGAVDKLEAGRPAADVEQKQLSTDEALQRAPGGSGRFWNRAPAETGLNSPTDLRFYRAIGPTERWVDSYYWRLPRPVSSTNRVQFNRFWWEYSQHTAGTPFLSTEFLLARENVSSALLALAVLDLPEQVVGESAQMVEGRLQWSSPSAALVFQQQLTELPSVGDGTPIMVSENFFDAANRYQLVENRQVDRFVRGPFATRRLYGAQVVVTNPTSSPQSINLLVQVPAGAIAVNGSQPTKTFALDLPAFGSVSQEYWFYFPQPGTWEHYPAHVAAKDQILAWATSLVFEVKEEQAAEDRNSWDFVSQQGSTDELLNWLRTHNLHEVDLSAIAFRMSDRTVYEAVMKILAPQYLFQPDLWSYAFVHRDWPRVAEYLSFDRTFLESCGPALETSWLSYSAEAWKLYEHTEFSPLVNARAHQTGSRRKILNDALWDQYSAILTLLCHRAEPNADEKLALVYYLLVQDRIEEAAEWARKIEREEVAATMAYDYIQAWLALSFSQAERAAQIAAEYREFPMATWKNRFAEIAAIATEASGGAAQIVDPESAQQQQTAAAANLPTLEIAAIGTDLKISHRNLAAITLEYHELDVELQFSRDPFSRSSSSGRSPVRPNFSERLELDPAVTETLKHLPEKYRSKNVLIEVRGGDQTATCSVFANDLDLQVVAAMGQLQTVARSDGRRLPGSYVKVYAETVDGRVEFYKDGYTDIRGRFDYVTQSSFPLDQVQRFSVLVLTEEHGCVTRLVNPPRR